MKKWNKEFKHHERYIDRESIQVIKWIKEMRGWGVIKISLPKISKNNNKIDIKFCMIRNPMFIFHLRSYLFELDTIKVRILWSSPQNSLKSTKVSLLWVANIALSYQFSNLEIALCSIVVRLTSWLNFTWRNSCNVYSTVDLLSPPLYPRTIP